MRMAKVHLGLFVAMLGLAAATGAAHADAPAGTIVRPVEVVAAVAAPTTATTPARPTRQRSLMSARKRVKKPVPTRAHLAAVARHAKVVARRARQRVLVRARARKLALRRAHLAAVARHAKVLARRARQRAMAQARARAEKLALQRASRPATPVGAAGGTTHPALPSLALDSAFGRVPVSSSGVLNGRSGDGAAGVSLIVPSGLLAFAVLLSVLAVRGQRRAERRRHPVD